VAAPIVFAHAGHWAVDALYLVPVLLLVGAALKERWKARREPRDTGEHRTD
jgi:hypothetical protein